MFLYHIVVGQDIFGSLYIRTTALSIHRIGLARILSSRRYNAKHSRLSPHFPCIVTSPRENPSSYSHLHGHVFSLISLFWSWSVSIQLSTSTVLHWRMNSLRSTSIYLSTLIDPHRSDCTQACNTNLSRQNDSGIRNSSPSTTSEMEGVRVLHSVRLGKFRNTVAS